MNLEIHDPALVERVSAQIESRRLRDVDELLKRALDALDEKAPAPTSASGEVVLEALDARPYPDIDLTPPRVRLTNVRDVVL